MNKKQFPLSSSKKIASNAVSANRRFSMLPRVFFLMCILTILVSTGSYAQEGGGGIVSGASQIGNTIIQVINIAFPVACGLALIAVVWYVFTKNPEWKGYAVGLIIGLILWGGYTTYKDEIFSYFGGTDQFSAPAGAGGPGGGN